MFRSLSGKLLASYLGVIIVTLGTVAALLAHFLSSYYYRLAATELESQGHRIAALARPHLESYDRTGLIELVECVGRANNTLVCISNANGCILANCCQRLERPLRLAPETVLNTDSTTAPGQLFYARQPVLSSSVPIQDASGAVLGRVLLHRPLVGLHEMVTRAHQFIFLAALGAIVGATFLGLGLAKTISRPLRAMQQMAGRLASGEYNARLEVRSADEVGQLAESFNELAVALQTTIHELNEEHGKLASVLTSMSEGVVATNGQGVIILANPQAEEVLSCPPGHLLQQQATEVKELDPAGELFPLCLESGVAQTEEFHAEGTGRDLLLMVTPVVDTQGHPAGAVGVLRDVTQARQLEALRRRFVSDVSHELRTPLSSIRGFVEALSDGTVEDPAGRRRYLDIIRREAAGMQHLIDDLLDLSRLETGDPRFNIQSLDLHSLLRRAVSRMEPQAREKEVDLVLEVAPGPGPVSGDPDRLDQVITSLLDNAIRYNRRGGQVVVQTARDAEGVTVTVRDTGIGIAVEELPYIWERFHKVDKSRTRGKGGTGLGLALVRAIVRAHGGSVSVQSEPDQGSEFSFTLPLSKRISPPPPDPA